MLSWEFELVPLFLVRLLARDAPKHIVVHDGKTYTLVRPGVLVEVKPQKRLSTVKQGLAFG